MRTNYPVNFFTKQKYKPHSIISRSTSRWGLAVRKSECISVFSVYQTKNMLIARQPHNTYYQQLANLLVLLRIDCEQHSLSNNTDLYTYMYMYFPTFNTQTMKTKLKPIKKQWKIAQFLSCLEKIA